ncbi:hypothetical protein LZ31DRAFT_163317 [Colletotrichum somersetense]|nr:hypothetical protein LZ31DRAFT_163317 [Colletotrichum somersetense]
MDYNTDPTGSRLSNGIGLDSASVAGPKCQEICHQLRLLHPRIGVTNADMPPSSEGPSRSRGGDLPLVGVRPDCNHSHDLYGCLNTAKSAACFRRDTQCGHMRPHLQPELPTSFHSSTPHQPLFAIFNCIVLGPYASQYQNLQPNLIVGS